MNSNQIREKIRKNQFHEPTCGHAKGFIQTNLVIIENKYADDFNDYCSKNSKPCPIVERLEEGSYVPTVAKEADLRTDLVSYKKFSIVHICIWFLITIDKKVLHFKD